MELRPGQQVRRRHRRPRHDRPGNRREDERIDRLSRLSAGRGVDAYADIGWDDPEMAIELGDPRLRLPSFDPLARSDWYRSRPDDGQALVGIWRTAAAMRIGCDFENFLQQALLRRVLARRGGPSEFRYAHHEVIEESQHTLMFHELVQRTGLPARGMPRLLRFVAQHSIGLAATRDPALFFLLVLTGEEPIDRQQRRSVAEGIEHPLLEKITRTHIAEEARHVSFAKLSLERRVPKLSRVRRHLLALSAPLILGYGARIILLPPREMAEALGAPHRTLTAPYRTPEGKRYFADVVSKRRHFLAEVGLMTRPATHLWKAVGLWDDDAHL